MDDLTCLIRNPWPEVKWGGKDRPVILVDGRLYLLKDTGNPITGKCAYIVGANNKNIDAICTSVNVEFLQFYDMQVKDLNPVKRISSLKHLAIRWNTKVLSIDPLGEIASLETLILEDTPRIESIDPVSRLKNLAHFEYSGGMWNKNQAKSLSPLTDLEKLQRVTLLNLKIGDDSLRPLVKCRSLKELDVSNQFSTEEYAFLAANMPEVKCEKFVAYIRLPSPIGDKDVMVVGRRKPFLNSSADKMKLDEYEEKFNTLKEELRLK